jgi:hypothetical protein
LGGSQKCFHYAFTHHTSYGGSQDSKNEKKIPFLCVCLFLLKELIKLGSVTIKRDTQKKRERKQRKQNKKSKIKRWIT